MLTLSAVAYQTGYAVSDFAFVIGDILRIRPRRSPQNLSVLGLRFVSWARNLFESSKLVCHVMVFWAVCTAFKHFYDASDI